MAKKIKEEKKKISDSELQLLQMKYNEEHGIEDNSHYNFGQIYNFDGLDVQNLKSLLDCIK